MSTDSVYSHDILAVLNGLSLLGEVIVDSSVILGYCFRNKVILVTLGQSLFFRLRKEFQEKLLLNFC